MKCSWKVQKPLFSKDFLRKSPQNHFTMTPYFMDFLPEYPPFLLIPPPLIIPTHFNQTYKSVILRKTSFNKS